MILALNIGNSNITFGGYTPDGKLVAGLGGWGNG